MIISRTGKSGKKLTQYQIDRMAEGRRLSVTNGANPGRPIKVKMINLLTNEEIIFRSVAKAIEYFKENVDSLISSKTLRKIIKSEKEYKDYK